MPKSMESSTQRPTIKASQQQHKRDDSKPKTRVKKINAEMFLLDPQTVNWKLCGAYEYHHQHHL